MSTQRKILSTQVSRFSKHRGEWLMMQANINESDVRSTETEDLGGGEEECTYVRNAVAAQAEEMKEVLDQLVAEHESPGIMCHEDRAYGKAKRILAKLRAEGVTT